MMHMATKAVGIWGEVFGDCTVIMAVDSWGKGLVTYTMIKFVVPGVRVWMAHTVIIAVGSGRKGLSDVHSNYGYYSGVNDLSDSHNDHGCWFQGNGLGDTNGNHGYCSEGKGLGDAKGPNSFGSGGGRVW